jgi:tRNA nucleotidyltransferase (CCA-adding enzyme)
MEIYKVGGAVRDKRLGLPVVDTDWVVVGGTPEEMLDAGYRQVGREFPVFLHPRTHEDYALARTERKVAPGYKGFTVHAAPDVTLEQDLRRRDLTINAMAETPDGRLIDPFGGAADLRRRVLRHVSPAFREDPVRILRVARFAARFIPRGFHIAPETVTLMRDMVTAGEVDALVPERVWNEMLRALGEDKPAGFFQALRDCGALARLFPEIDALFGVPQPPEHHPEVDCGVHTLMVVDQAARLSSDARVRFAALMHDLGKGQTPPALWPRHSGHEERSVTLVRAVCKRLRAPRDFLDLAVLTARYHGHVHRAGELRPATVWEVLHKTDAWRRQERFEAFLMACQADAGGRTGYEDRPYPQAVLLRRAARAAAAVDGAALAAQGLSGGALGEALRRLQIDAIDAACAAGD